MLAATSRRLAHIGTYGIAVGSESSLRLAAPVRRRIVLIVEFFVAGIRNLTDVHRLVADVQAVRAECDFGRAEELAHS